MKIINIQESGTSNILQWAIANGANIKEDVPLQSLINDELFYIVTLSDVNFFELMRLTQMYRDKLRIVDEHQADIPPVADLKERFPGKYTPEADGSDEINLYEAVDHTITNFVNIVTQMASDEDVINPSARRLFLPMITRTFNIQVPIAFIDFIDSMTDDEASKMFIPEYPTTLEDVVDAAVHGVKTVLSVGFTRGTSIIRYDNRYDQYLKLIKYAPLRKERSDTRLYKFGIIGFSKRDPIGRGEVRCSLFKPNNDTITKTLKRIGKLNTPMDIDFAVQLPLQYLQMLENYFGRDVLNISYESSMSSIIEGGLVYEDFNLPMYDLETEDPEEKAKLAEYNNAVHLYRVRIAEANQLMLNIIPILINSNTDVDTTSVFAMLPSIYSAKAVITLNTENYTKYLSHPEPLIREMLQDMIDSASKITEDISKAK